MYDRGGANVTQSLVHLHRRFLLMFWVSIFSLIFIIWYGFIYAQPYTDCDRDLVKWMKVQVIFSSIRVVLKIGILSSLASLLERSITTHAGEATTQVIRGWHFNAHRVVFFIESFWFVFGIQHALDEDECRDANPNVYSVVVGFMFAAAAFAFIRSHQSIVSCAVKFQTQRFTIPSNQDKGPSKQLASVKVSSPFPDYLPKRGDVLGWTKYSLTMPVSVSIVKTIAVL
eukprot:GHVR01180805.1.p1 GENE.GHVR01180805.1~~GHVR01180805.1.p1  ORF type:complete len:237 (+),score=23.22 GHVR01180805.1:30-713(+)